MTGVDGVGIWSEVGAGVCAGDEKLEDECVCGEGKLVVSDDVTGDGNDCKDVVDAKV